MSSINIGFVLLLLAVGDITPVTSLCQDIDPAACPALEKQSPNFCNEPGLSDIACPRYCKKCPLRCFNCLLSDVKSAWCSNTTECNPGEQCMLRELQSSADGHSEVLMQCASVQVCDMLSPSAGFVGKRDVSIHCCKDDLCNVKNVTKHDQITSTPRTTPPATTTSTRATTTRPPTPKATTTRPPTPPPPTTTTTLATTRPITLPPGCSVDITILLQDSAKRTTLGTWAITDFLKDTISKLRIGLQYNKVAVTLFDQKMHTQWTLDSREAIDKTTLMTAIDGLPFQYKTDNIRYDHVTNFLRLVSNHTVANNRPWVRHVVLIIADSDTELNRFAGERFGVDKILYISIGQSAFMGSFHNIAQYPQHMFSVTGQNVEQGLNAIQMKLLVALCDTYYIRH